MEITATSYVFWFSAGLLFIFEVVEKDSSIIIETAVLLVIQSCFIVLVVCRPPGLVGVQER